MITRGDIYHRGGTASNFLTGSSLNRPRCNAATAAINVFLQFVVFKFASSHLFIYFTLYVDSRAVTSDYLSLSFFFNLTDKVIVKDKFRTKQ